MIEVPRYYVDELVISGVDTDAPVVIRARVVPQHIGPALPAVIRSVHAGPRNAEVIWQLVGRLDIRPNEVGALTVDADVDLACFAGGQAVGQFLPRSSRVRGSVDAAVRPAAVHAVRGAQPLVHPDEQDVRVVRAHRDDCGAGASIIGKPVRELFPRLAAVRRLVQPSCP